MILSHEDKIQRIWILAEVWKSVHAVKRNFNERNPDHLRCKNDLTYQAIQLYIK